MQEGFSNVENSAKQTIQFLMGLITKVLPLIQLELISPHFIYVKQV
jgi:hypothetical protein